MRTEPALAIVAVALAATIAPRSARADAPGPWLAVVDLEASVVGESYGGRGELLWRIGRPGTASHLRAAAGILPGPELTFVPLSLGYRALWRSDRTVQPFAGAGWESQHFLISDAPTVHRWVAVYAEAGCGFAIHPRVSLGVATSVDVALVGGVGPGLQLRSFASWRF